jgi:hypothetical protein
VLNEAIWRFLFEPESWADPNALEALVWSDDQEILKRLGLKPTPRQWRQLINQSHRLSDIDLDLFAQRPAHRLLLLDLKSLRRLSLAACLLPFFGKVCRSMDGNFRRTSRLLFSEAELQRFDAQSSMAQTVRFSLPASQWREPERLIQSGMASLFEAIDASPVLHARAQLKFPPRYLDADNALSGLNAEHLELLCKVSLPDHPWLSL